MTSVDTAVGIGGLFLVVIGAVIGAFKYFSGEITSARREASAHADEAVQAVKELMVNVRRDLDSQGVKIDTIVSQAVLRPELSQMESRVSLMIERSDRLHNDAFNRASADRQAAFDRMYQSLVDAVDRGLESPINRRRLPPSGC
jgi:ribosomal protein L31E